MCGDFVEGGNGDVGSLVAVAWIRLCEAVHMQQLPVGHLPIGVEYLLAFMYGPHTDHLQIVLRNTNKRKISVRTITEFAESPIEI